MAGKANFLGHPIHPMLIAFPLGIFPIAVLFDILYLIKKNGYWAGFSFWLIAIGIIS